MLSGVPTKEETEIDNNFLKNIKLICNCYLNPTCHYTGLKPARCLQLDLNVNGSYYFIGLPTILETVEDVKKYIQLHDDIPLLTDEHYENIFKYFKEQLEQRQG